MDKEKVYLNGALVPLDEAKISVYDVGFLHGGSVFTTFMARHGRPFRLPMHLDRLFDTTELFALRTTATREELTRAVDALLRANSLQRARLRITLTPGHAASEEATTVITAAELPPYPAEIYEQGVMVVVSSIPQAQGDPTFGYKTGCYFTRICARQEAQRKGGTDALWFTPDKRLAEGCFTNVFLVKAGVLLTPPRDTPVLPGVTRATVLELAAKLCIEARDDRDLFIDDLLDADEAFLTASTMGIVPVSRVEGSDIGSGEPGPVTRRLREGLEETIERETGGQTPSC